MAEYIFRKYFDTVVSFFEEVCVISGSFKEFLEPFSKCSSFEELRAEAHAFDPFEWGEAVWSDISWEWSVPRVFAYDGSAGLGMFYYNHASDEWGICLVTNDDGELIASCWMNPDYDGASAEAFVDAGWSPDYDTYSALLSGYLRDYDPREDLPLWGSNHCRS